MQANQQEPKRRKKRGKGITQYVPVIIRIGPEQLPERSMFVYLPTNRYVGGAWVNHSWVCSPQLQLR